MRVGKSVNWLVLALISFLALYLLYGQKSMEEGEGRLKWLRGFRKNAREKVKSDLNSVDRIDINRLSSVNGGVTLNASFKLGDVSHRGLGVKNKLKLWRSSGESGGGGNAGKYGNKTKAKDSKERDKVFELMEWIEQFSTSSYLQNAKPKKILVFDGIENYYSTEGGLLNCPFNSSKKPNLLEQKCLIHEDKPLEVANYASYDYFVGVRNWRHVIYDRRISSIKHVFYIEESPFVAKYADLTLNNPILASYWRGSDIVLPYGYFKKYSDATNTNSSSSSSAKLGRNENSKPGATQNLDYALGKTKLVAIIVSNCDAINNRLKYVNELSRYIPVHIYGACGPHRCGDGSGSCYEMIRKEYKFYLAFEKANCKDYITEKFWTNALRYSAVPVVMGAHPEDYKALAPPNSYIHVEAYSTPKDLADYLVLLDGNDTLYNEYFGWKREGTVEGVWHEFFCRLCGMLFYMDFHEPPPWPRGSTWGSVNRCLVRDKWYWTRDDPKFTG